MVEQTCHWKYCRTKIEVDTSLGSGLFNVVGWCDVHKAAFTIYTSLEKRFCKKAGIDWPVGSLSYKKYKESFDQLHELAGHRAKQEARE